jgi:hypothetical protein
MPLVLLAEHVSGSYGGESLRFSETCIAKRRRPASRFDDDEVDGLLKSLQRLLC